MYFLGGFLVVFFGVIGTIIRTPELQKVRNLGTMFLHILTPPPPSSPCCVRLLLWVYSIPLQHIALLQYLPTEGRKEVSNISRPAAPTMWGTSLVCLAWVIATGSGYWEKLKRKYFLYHWLGFFNMLNDFCLYWRMDWMANLLFTLTTHI